VLKELSDLVRKYTESEPLLQTVSKCVSETLHVSQIGFLLRGGADFKLTRAIGASPGSTGTLTLASHSSTIRNLTSTNSPVQLYREEPDAWYLMAGQSERRTLDELGAELFLPLSGRNRLMGG
jgi:sigma-B regulation protein RsbU (phosphoserine phosphatase)